MNVGRDTYTKFSSFSKLVYLKMCFTYVYKSDYFKTDVSVFGVIFMLILRNPDENFNLNFISLTFLINPNHNFHITFTNSDFDSNNFSKLISRKNNFFNQFFIEKKKTFLSPHDIQSFFIIFSSSINIYMYNVLYTSRENKKTA